MYNWLKFLHVASVILWVGGMMILILLNRRLARSMDQSFMQTFNQQMGSLSVGLFMPSALVALITGIGMVQVGEIGFFHIWIMWGIIGSIASFFIGGVLAGGAARKLARQMAQGTVDAAHVASVQRRITAFAMLNVLLLLTIVWVMVFKIG